MLSLNDGGSLRSIVFPDIPEKDKKNLNKTKCLKLRYKYFQLKILLTVKLN